VSALGVTGHDHHPTRQESALTTPPTPTLPLLGDEPVVVAPDEHDVRMWSVTTLIGVLDKPALVPWAAIKTAECAVDKLSTWTAILESDGRAEAVNYLKNARFKGKRGERSATELGTAVHRACEYAAIEGKFRPEDIADEELKPFLRQFRQFLRDFQPKYVAAEVTVFSPTYGYAGTCDAFLEIDGTRFIVDYKTSRESNDSQGKPKGPYPEVALQLAAYRYAELAAVWRARQAEQMKRRYYLLNDTERALAVPVPEVDHGLVIYLTPDRYAVHPIRCDEAIHEHFLSVIDSARYVLDVGKSVIGNPLIPPRALRDSTDPFAGLPTE
jgi:ATP-dependent exoDNAse (exonuclease V) beta subunit